MSKRNFRTCTYLGRHLKYPLLCMFFLFNCVGLKKFHVDLYITFFIHMVGVQRVFKLFLIKAPRDLLEYTQSICALYVRRVLLHWEQGIGF